VLWSHTWKVVRSSILKKKAKRLAKNWWLMPVVLAIQETEIKRIMVPGKPKQKCLQDLISREKSWVWCYVLLIPVTAGSVK
jgi:hypothetical protein